MKILYDRLTEIHRRHAALRAETQQIYAQLLDQGAGNKVGMENYIRVLLATWEMMFGIPWEIDSWDYKQGGPTARTTVYFSPRTASEPRVGWNIMLTLSCEISSIRTADSNYGLWEDGYVLEVIYYSSNPKFERGVNLGNGSWLLDTGFATSQPPEETARKAREWIKDIFESEKLELMGRALSLAAIRRKK